MGKAERMQVANLHGLRWIETGGAHFVHGIVQVESSIVFQPQFELATALDDPPISSSVDHYIGWLPRGTYAVSAPVPPVLAERGRLMLRMSHLAGFQSHLGAATEVVRSRGSATNDRAPQPPGWSVTAVAPTVDLASLSWRKGHEDWFFRHFDHAASTVVSYLLGDDPRLKGRILDVGCGDGITDLGIALRTRCQELVGIDPFSGFDRLPSIIAANHLPADVMRAANIRFMAEDANFLPFPDDSFDVLLSWGSIEHIAGGYLQALREMKRVLRPDGLLMMHPGLYYSNAGHHLGEFSGEPFFHLKKSRDEIRRMVLDTPPRYIDRAGEFSSNEQYFQWFTELNPITVTSIERELRALDFRPWRIALRTEPIIEYTPEIEHYPIQDLATAELYSSWINRKKPRPR